MNFLMPHLRRRLALIGGAILFTLTLGTVGFVLIEHYPLFDAFYMTVITISTVGYTEVHRLTRAGQLFNSFLILFGVTTLLLAVGVMTQTVIELELNQFFGKRRVRGMIDKLKDHYIVCGYGRVGRGASEELKRAGVPFVIVDRSEDRVERAIHNGMLAVEGDATRDETLHGVGVDRARGLIASLASDADNLFVVLSAKSLNPRLQVASRVSEQEAEQKVRRAGADFVFVPYSNTGYRMAQALIRPHVFQFIDFTTQNMGLDVCIEQFHVNERSKAAGMSLGELRLPSEFGTIVLAIRNSNGNMAFNPPAEARIAGGDYLIVMGEAEDLVKLEKILTEVDG